MDLQAVLIEVETWPRPERVRLFQVLRDRLGADALDTELSDEMKAEIDRRLAEHEANPDAAIPWETVEAEMLARLRR